MTAMLLTASELSHREDFDADYFSTLIRQMA
jgi:hypothetical protein